MAFSFYDDKYGFEPVGSVESARLTAECVHTWLGARYDQKKLQLTSSPTILGVTYNLEKMQLKIKPERRPDLLSEICSILESDLLDPGSAGKLKEIHVWSLAALGESRQSVLKSDLREAGCENAARP